MVKTCTGNFRFSDHPLFILPSSTSIFGLCDYPGHGPSSHKIQYITETDKDAHYQNMTLGIGKAVTESDTSQNQNLSL